MYKEDVTNISKYFLASKMDYNLFVSSKSIINQPKWQKQRNPIRLKSQLRAHITPITVAVINY